MIATAPAAHTFLFMDLVGFTALTAERGDGDAADIPPVRVSVHTGTAVQREGDWYGNAVNVAARLCSAAAGGEVLVSDDARAATGALHGVELGDRQLHWLKNVPEPVVAWSASAADPAGPRRPWARLAPSLPAWPGLCPRHSQAPA